MADTQGKLEWMNNYFGRTAVDRLMVFSSSICWWDFAVFFLPASSKWKLGKMEILGTYYSWLIIHKNTPFQKLIYRHEGTFAVDGDILKLVCGDVCTFTKNRWIVHLKISVYFVVYKLQWTKAGFLKSLFWQFPRDLKVKLPATLYRLNPTFDFFKSLPIH